MMKIYKTWLPKTISIAIPHLGLVTFTLDDTVAQAKEPDSKYDEKTEGQGMMHALKARAKSLWESFEREVGQLTHQQVNAVSSND